MPPMNLDLLIFSTFLILLQSPGAVPVIVTTSKPYLEVRENEDAVLSCSFVTERDPSPRIEWKRKGRDVSFVYFNGMFIGDFAGRAKIDGATVTLGEVTQRDAGVYRCEVSTHLDRVNLGEINVTLVVLVPPDTPTCEIPSWAPRGTMVQMRCRDKQSIPPATYRWYKDKQLLGPNGLPNVNYTLDPKAGTLLLTAVSPAVQGEYHCEASNGVGESQSCTGKHIRIDDQNVPGITVTVVAVLLVLFTCAIGACYAHQNGYCNKGHSRSSNNNGYISTPPDLQHYKHTQSFML